MGRRHEIQNLVRRGNMFHWRPRIPRQFSEIAERHLSLSLHLSDHRKAQYMARRLNTLLHELKLTPGAAVTTKDQLESLFRAEAVRMSEHLDNLSFAARRVGTDAALSAKADIEIGWAYRLIELFGTMRKLSFEPGCPGRSALERASIPEPSIATIATAFTQEQADCRHSHFEKALVADMAAHGIADTLINRERATAQLMRAKADMLLAVPSRYPELRGSNVAEILADKVMAATDNGTPSVAKPFATQSAVVEQGASPTDSETRVQSEYLMPEQSVVVAEHAATPVPLSAPPPKDIPLPVTEFMTRCQKLIAGKKDWERKTGQDVRVVVATFVGILGEHGVKTSAEITQFHLGRLRDHFDEIPTTYGQSSRLRRLSTRELREAASRQVEIAKARNQQPPKIGLEANTIRKHLTNLGEFLRSLRGRGFAVADLSMDGLRPAKLKSGDLRTLTDKPDENRLRPLFDMAVFTGCRSAEEQGVAGGQVFHSANYYLPMLLAYLGSRRNEMAGLAVKDIVETSNGWAIEIRPNALRRIKNSQSVRTLPVPDEVLRLGLLPYVRAIRDLGYSALFPELYTQSSDNDAGDRFYKDFMPLVKKSEVAGQDVWARFLHALRHGNANTLKQKRVSIEIIDDISGRLSRGETSVRYTNAAGLPLVRSALANYPTVTGHLEPQPLQLLPWVAKRQSPPWAGRSRSQRLADARSVRSERAKTRRKLD
ncbi:DUF6538 domain-containing protein [Aminobacter sp. DSM 101952]|uniref:DUF6538 domain-containing protein n=1 Tax=Aminobacter sp. DSM 101952 TaxID=2735891 RepID=UPI000A42A7F6|nr:DUF6538 domain-containing protein [Aminobacter sp. DSM 101952]